MQQADGRPSEKRTGHTVCAAAQRACQSSRLKKFEEGIDHTLVQQSKSLKICQCLVMKGDHFRKEITTLASELLQRFYLHEVGINCLIAQDMLLAMLAQVGHDDVLSCCCVWKLHSY